VQVAEYSDRELAVVAEPDTGVIWNGASSLTVSLIEHRSGSRHGKHGEKYYIASHACCGNVWFEFGHSLMEDVVVKFARSQVDCEKHGEREEKETERIMVARNMPGAIRIVG
jgi:hypothetical protein